MLDYPALRAVAAVVQTGSFERAAALMNVTPSAISQRIKHLEERLGTGVIVRGSPCVATEKGAWLCRHMETVGMLESELLEQLPDLAANPANHRVTVSIATNADSLGTWFLDAVANFSRRSSYLLDIAVDDQDHTAQWLERGRVLGAVTSLEAPVRGCKRISLGSLRYVATADADFVNRHFPDGVTAATLLAAPALVFNQKDRLQALWVRRTIGEDVVLPAHFLPSTQGFVSASLSGMGWCLNPEQLVAEHLAAGRLVELVPGSRIDTPLYWQINRIAADRLEPLTRQIVSAARQQLVQEPEPAA
jgi:LysR family transcriptional regulator (chromosome initiation inhibitor)